MYAQQKEIWDLNNALDELNLIVPLQAFMFQPEATIPGYIYRFIAKDGRRWRQTLLLEPNQTDPAMTFAVPQGWKISEFNKHRPLRDLVIHIYLAFGLQDVQITWF